MTLEMPDEQEPVRQPTQVADSAPKAEKLVKGMSKRDYMREFMRQYRAKRKAAKQDDATSQA